MKEAIMADDDCEMCGEIDAWWLHLSDYRLMCRAHIASLMEDGRQITWRGARHIYKAARDGTMYVKPGTMTPAHID
jgi:hypothetical protein